MSKTFEGFYFFFNIYLIQTEYRGFLESISISNTQCHNVLSDNLEFFWEAKFICFYNSGLAVE